MKKFLAQSEHSVNVCHDCYYCFIITIVVILALGKLNKPTQASPGRIHSCTQNRKQSHWHRSELTGRQRLGGTGFLLPTPSPQSHATPHLRPICRRLLLWSWQQPQKPAPGQAGRAEAHAGLHVGCTGRSHLHQAAWEPWKPGRLWPAAGDPALRAFWSSSDPARASGWESKYHPASWLRALSRLPTAFPEF